MSKENNDNPENADEVIRQLGRIAVGGYYDHQQIRTSHMNRIRDVLRKRNEGIPFDQTEEKKEKKAYDKAYSDKNIEKLLDKMLEEKKLSQEEYDYIKGVFETAKMSKKLETSYTPLMTRYIKTQPIWEWLNKVKGIGSILASNVLYKFGHCETYRQVSSLWKHCGLHVQEDGTAPKRQRGVKLDFDLKLRTLCWKIADSFVKQRSQPYRRIYDAEKRRQLSLMENDAPNKPVSLLHADLRARRKMVKIFLSHYWSISRRLVGLPITKPYAFEKLGHKSYIPPPHIEESWLWKEEPNKS